MSVRQFHRRLFEFEWSRLGSIHGTVTMHVKFAEHFEDLTTHLVKIAPGPMWSIGSPDKLRKKKEIRPTFSLRTWGDYQGSSAMALVTHFLA